MALLPARREAPRDRYRRKVVEYVQSRRPEVAFSSSGPVDAIYQANIWLPVLEQLDLRVLVVLRERPSLDGPAPTTLPVVAIPTAVDLTNFRLPTVRVAFYAAHVGSTSTCSASRA